MSKAIDELVSDAHKNDIWSITGHATDIYGAVELNIEGNGIHLIVVHDLTDDDAVKVARLVCAAPELLEALEEAIAELQECTVELTGEDYNNPKFNAAIAKATKEDRQRKGRPVEASPLWPG